MKRGTPNHPKTLWLKAGLGISKREVVGLLEMLFHFVATTAPQGDIGKWSNAQIAEAVEWTGNPDELVSEIVDAGFFDEDKTHRLLVHDWAEHADGAVKKHLARSGLQFAKPSANVRTKSGQRRPQSGQRRPAVAVPFPALPSQAKPTEAVADAPAAWTHELTDDWREIYKGDPPPSAYKHLAPFVRSKGWAVIRAPLRAYLSETPVEFVNLPKAFIGAFGQWQDRANGAPARASPRKSVGDTLMDNARQAIEAHRRASGD